MFAGVFCLTGERTPGQVIGDAGLLGALCPGDPPAATGTWAAGPFLIAQASMWTAPAGLEVDPGYGLPYRCPTTGRVIAFWGRLDNRAELERTLGLPPERASDAEAVLAAYARWGPDCAERLDGDLAAAVVEPAPARLWLVRDRLGVKPLYYRIAGDVLVFATSAAVLLTLRPVTEGIDRTWIARELTGVPHDETATPWSDVAKLAPGHSLEVTLQERRLRRYHTWRDDPPWATERDPRWVSAYRTALEEAVRCRMRGTDLIGSESSGGIDSGTVTAYLARFLGQERQRLCALGFASSQLEAKYIGAISLHSGIPCTLLLSYAEEVDDALERGLAAVGYPALGSGASFLPIYEECRRRGIRTLFSGFGGDESVTNSGSLLGRELRDRRAYRALAATVQGSPPLRLARVVRAVMLGPRWGAGHPQLERAMAARWPRQLVRDELAEELGLLESYQQQAAFDAPYRRINEFVLHNRLGSNISRRLETCTLVAATYGLDYRWPLLDARLVQQWLSTPSIEKANRAFGRYLHRRAIDGVLEPQVAWKPTKDMGVTAPTVVERGFEDGSLLDAARRQRGELHPVLVDVISTERLDAQIAAAAADELDREGRFQFARNVMQLRWLNRWLWTS
jgi:asparagine synthase (glutamine-hydrolysing)